MDVDSIGNWGQKKESSQASIWCCRSWSICRQEAPRVLGRDGGLGTGVKHEEIKSIRVRNVFSCRCVLSKQIALSDRAGAAHSPFYY